MLSLILPFLIHVLYKWHKIQDIIHFPIIHGNKLRKDVIVGKPADNPSCHRRGAQQCGYPHPLWQGMVTLVELLLEQTSCCSGVTTAPAQLSLRPPLFSFPRSPVPSGTWALTTESRCQLLLPCQCRDPMCSLSFLLFKASICCWVSLSFSLVDFESHFYISS